jgi:RNA polymerase sigma factor (sigma-70 family)
MVDKPGDTGGVAAERHARQRTVRLGPTEHAPSLPAADKAARDTEFTLFYYEQMPHLVAFLMVQGARENEAFDAAHEAMIEAYRGWDGINYPGAWVRTVATRAWWRRVEQNRAETVIRDVDERARASADESEDVENRHVFLAVVQDLPPAQREVMAWTYDGYRPTEIAIAIGKTSATVRSLLRDARKSLKRTYRPDEEAP